MPIDPRLAADLISVIDTRVRQILRMQPRTAYGVVASVDTANKKCSVYLSADTSASPGFSYTSEPAVGDRVRVVIDPRGDRYVDSNAGGGSGAGVPTGTILPYAGDGATPPDEAPAGFLLCRGYAVSRTTYADLFAVIGTKFGAGNGSTTFNLPDFTNRFPLGSDVNANVGAVGGALDHTHTSAGHTHTNPSTSSDSHSHTSAAHSHPLSGSGWAQVNVAAGASTVNAYVKRTGTVASWTPTLGPKWTYTASDTNTQSVGAQLDGNTDSATPGSTGADSHSHTQGSTGSTTPGATGANNPPYQKVNYVIKT